MSDEELLDLARLAGRLGECVVAEAAERLPGETVSKASALVAHAPGET